MARLTLIAVLSITLLGCDLFRFDDHKDEAGVIVRSKPSAFSNRGGFGTTLAGFTAQLTSGGNTQQVSRLAVGGGTGGALVVYEIWKGGELTLGAPLDEKCDEVEDPGCGFGFGAALAGLPVWAPGAGSSQRRGCVLATHRAVQDPESEPPQLHLVCAQGQRAADAGPLVEGRDETINIVDQQDFEDEAEFGISAAALPEGSPLGEALIGAPDTADGEPGEVYRLDGRNLIELSGLDSASLGNGARIGGRVAAAKLPGGQRSLVATSALARNRVVVAVSQPVSGMIKTDVHACLGSGGDTGFGRALAVGNVLGDDTPDVVVGGASSGVAVYDGAQLAGLRPVTGGCGDPPEPDVVVACPEEQPRSDVDVVCPELDMSSEDDAVRRFGAAVATGDLDGERDGDVDELLVGAPGATVDDTARAGAVYVFKAQDGGLAVRDVLTDSQPGQDALLGARLSTVRTRLGTEDARDEPVASALGDEAIAVFLCSGLEGDTPEVGRQCVGMP